MPSNEGEGDSQWSPSSTGRSPAVSLASSFDRIAPSVCSSVGSSLPPSGIAGFFGGLFQGQPPTKPHRTTVTRRLGGEHATQYKTSQHATAKRESRPTPPPSQAAAQVMPLARLVAQDPAQVMAEREPLLAVIAAPDSTASMPSPSQARPPVSPAQAAMRTAKAAEAEAAAVAAAEASSSRAQARLATFTEVITRSTERTLSEIEAAREKLLTEARNDLRDSLAGRAGGGGWVAPTGAHQISQLTGADDKARGGSGAANGLGSKCSDHNQAPTSDERLEAPQRDDPDTTGGQRPKGSREVERGVGLQAPVASAAAPDRVAGTSAARSAEEKLMHAYTAGAGDAPGGKRSLYASGLALTAARTMAKSTREKLGSRKQLVVSAEPLKSKEQLGPDEQLPGGQQQLAVSTKPSDSKQQLGSDEQLGSVLPGEKVLVPARKVLAELMYLEGVKGFVVFLVFFIACLSVSEARPDPPTRASNA